MSDYLFMLESHLNAEQIRVSSEVQACAAESNLSLFLTGGAMRDMLAGFPIRDLNFTVEGSGIKLAKALAAKHGAEVLSMDETRKSAVLQFPGGVRAQVAMARQDKYSKPGARPSVRRPGVRPAAAPAGGTRSACRTGRGRWRRHAAGTAAHPRAP